VHNSDQALVEISDERGHGLDFVSRPHDALAAPPIREPIMQRRTNRATALRWRTHHQNIECWPETWV
jgi:hypothetical protein